jgi:hypothetical protein
MTILGLHRKREVYDRGNGSAILLYNTKQKTVILTRQFRLTYLNGNKTGMMIEVCAGMLDQDNAKMRHKRNRRRNWISHNSS